MGDFYGKEFAYADTRLKDSIVMHDGDPVVVYGVTSGGSATVALLSDESRNTFSVPLRSLDVTPVKLGYVNYKGRTCYAMRMPKRRDWKQGLRGANITSMGGEVHIHAVPDKEWAKTIVGDYPTYEACLKAVARTAKSLAWSREWCVSKDLSLWHKGVLVGKVVDGQPLLSGRYQYLSECLRESL